MSARYSDATPTSTGWHLLGHVERALLVQELDRLLRPCPRSGPHLLAEAGERTPELVDIGDGWACAFQIESHNHPSAIEPYQGAATGVGGINRDIFTMGARPIAQLNSLRFGDITAEAARAGTCAAW